MAAARQCVGVAVVLAVLALAAVVRGAGVEVDGMVRLDAATFIMGTDAKDARDGEGPAKREQVAEFFIDTYAVSNADFRDFVRATKYKTEAEKFGWSFVFHSFVTPRIRDRVTQTVKDAEWWLPIEDAYWRKPFGPGSSIKDKLNFPAVQMSHADATAYCKWAGKRLPSEAEWEYAARGGLREKTYPWGDNFEKNRMNGWEGKFPDHNSVEDGFHGVAARDAYGPQNGYGLFNMVGNAWEWVADEYDTTMENVQRMIQKQEPTEDTKFVLRGGSYLDSRDGKTNHKLRVTTRMGNTPDSGSDNLSFRCAASTLQAKKLAKQQHNAKSEL